MGAENPRIDLPVWVDAPLAEPRTLIARVDVMPWRMSQVCAEEIRRSRFGPVGESELLWRAPSGDNIGICQLPAARHAAAMKPTQEDSAPMPSTSPEITYRRWMLAGSAGSEENYYSLGVMVPATLHAPFVALNQRAQMGGFNPPPRIAAAMMIDTGATGCVVDTRVVDALKLVPKRHTKMMQADGILVPTRIYELTAVLFFSSDEGTETLAINIEAAEMKVTTVGVEGILGRNFLRLFRFEVDGSRGTWSLSYDQPVPADMVPLK